MIYLATIILLIIGPGLLAFHVFCQLVGRSCAALLALILPKPPPRR